MADEPFLSRWSKRKTEARSGTPPPEPPERPAASPPVPEGASPGDVAAPAQPLPPVESLTPESDFTGFMKPEVEEGLKRRALKALFRDPHFNVMDGLDVYIDDYSKPDPLPESWLAQLKQTARLGAYEEKVADAAQESAEAPPEPLDDTRETLEKPADEQGLATPASTAAADTPDGGAAPPRVPE
jgi:hypothetical protein